jgi:epoxyqueuosine reductase
MAFTYRNPDRSTDPGRALPGATALVVGALHYRRTDAPPRARPVATVARYARDDHYGVLRGGLDAVAARLRADGWRARVLVDDNALVDRAAAVRAGIGWYGKNANVLVPGRGSWFVLGSVVTDAPLAGDREAVADGCGSCTRCIDGCPTGAIVAPGVVDARRCLAWLVQAPGSFPVEHRAALGSRIYGCDDCQEVCPPNRLEDRRERPAESDATVVDVLELLALDDAELLARYGRWYIAQRDPRFVRRNALVVLGNVGRADDPDVRAALDRHAEGDDEMLAEHARWALERLERTA